jgi:hypothetical protein
LSGNDSAARLFNNQPILGATHKSLALHNVQAANAGNYKVVIRNPAGVITSAPATLTVNAAAALLRAPATNGNPLPIFVPLPGNGALIGQVGVTAGQIAGNFSWIAADGTILPLTLQSTP